MSRSELNYHRDLKINRARLHDEWNEQSGLYMDYAELLADAKKEMAKAHERIKICKADLVAEAKNSKDSLTVQEVESYYRRDKRHKNAKTEFIDAEHRVNILMSAVIAFSQRKSALENLVQLWKGGYYSKPKEERDPNAPMRQLGAEASRKGRKKVEKRMRRNQT